MTTVDSTAARRGTGARPPGRHGRRAAQMPSGMAAQNALRDGGTEGSYGVLNM